MSSAPIDEADEMWRTLQERWRMQFGKKAEDRIGHIYFLRFREFVKIGWSQNLKQRLRQFNELLPESVFYEHTLQVSDVVAAEDWLHVYFEAKRKKGEWFVLDEVDIEFIKSLSDKFYVQVPYEASEP